MESDFGTLDILLLAGLAIFLIYRLYSVLGQKGQGRSEKRASFIARRMEKLDQELKEAIEKEFKEQKERIALKRKNKTEELTPSYDKIDIGKPVSVKAGLNYLEKTMPDFNEEAFLKGAKKAFQMIVMAYANGEIKKIKPYVSPAIYNSFQTLLKKRKEEGKTLSIHIDKIDSADLYKIEFLKRKVRLTVHFTSQQTILLKDKKGKILQGEEGVLEEIKDVWTFERALNANSNIWTLVKMA